MPIHFYGPGVAILIRLVAITSFLCLFTLQAGAAGSRQLATGGATMFEGAAGGGISPWAVLNGYATREEIGATGGYNHLDTGDYRLAVASASINIKNRLEVSFAEQELDLITLGPALGLPGATLEQEVLGLKLRLFGDVIYSDEPQVSLGLQYKKNRAFAIPSAVGARDDNGVDVYLSAAKLFLGGAFGYNLFLNGTIRYTDANETGLLGFGGPNGSDHSVNAEVSAAVLFSRRFVAGIEYRQKSSNLAGLPEDDWYDVFVGYFPNRHVSIVAAYVNLGEVASVSDQTGWYLAIEGSF